MTAGPDDWAAQPDPFPSFVLQIQYPDFLEPSQPPCLDDPTRAQVADALRVLLSGTFPDAFVDAQCAGADTEPAGRSASFAVWAFGPRDPSPDRLQELRAAARFPIGRQRGEMIALSFSQRFLNSLAVIGAGQPDDQAVHIHTAWTELEPPATVRTLVSGTDERPWPDAHFTMTIAEALALSGGQFQLPDPKVSLDVDNSLLHDLIGIGSMFLNPIITGIAFYQAGKVNQAGPPDEHQSGVVTGLISALLGPSVPVPGGQKLNLLYDRGEVLSDSVRAGGVITGRVPRTPSVRIARQTSLTFQPVQGVIQELYGLVDVQDVLPPITIAWTVDGQPAGNGSAISVKFTAPGPGVVQFQDVSVTVTDRDGLTAGASLRVELGEPKAQTDHGHHHDGPGLHEF
jgi:hypothetical protein